jgi:hypothetical protein
MSGNIEPMKFDLFDKFDSFNTRELISGNLLVYHVMQDRQYE